MLLRRDKQSSVFGPGLRPAALLACLLLACGFQFSNAYYSPRNSERDPRRSTRYIILHTTEAASSSSLITLRDQGEANFCVDTDGRVYRIIDHRRTAFHCGRSMWEGLVNIDDYAIGIEVVGYHNRDITPAQYQAIAALLAELKFLYRIPDERVLTHSMVAYGAPNKWFGRSHRGRKRCGMLFARGSVRQKLHLSKQPRVDPDVRAGRLINADPYLASVLYGTAAEQDRILTQSVAAPAPNVVSARLSVWDIARDAYNRADTVYILPDGTRRAGNQIRKWKSVPIGTKILVAETNTAAAEEVQTIGEDGASAVDIAGDEAWSASTFYIFRNGSCTRGSKLPRDIREKLPAGTRMLVGFSVGGPIRPALRAYEICGMRWKSPDTFYLLPGGTLKTGSEIKDDKLATGTLVFYRN
ncbi:MAG: peptidoglycan recognition family protein [bacterium]